MLIIPLLSNVSADANGQTVDVEDYGSGCIQIVGNLGGGTVSFQGSLDGVTFKPVFGIDSTGSPVSSVTVPELVFLNLGGLKSFRAPLTGSSSPSLTTLLSKFGQSGLSINGAKVLSTSPSGTEPAEAVRIVSDTYLQEVRCDYYNPGDGTNHLRYEGTNLQGTATASGGWVVRRFEWGPGPIAGAYLVMRIQILTGIWDNRVTLPWT